ncbi:GNAT family N-acetyltransferase [Oleiagrimonas soli]|uniref:RimJ/RimL family protein N-acetyltransferase n=1 Tax=Oleiagrimonas soli TaxID=1543381 RepID=A0A841KT91_9GAMM|nr:GNAT family N-acetyltransferase [Oleiagrimonas soli]MBB6185168.1 RimJ/RimL family protein N-acetyltransferase [Oleiagrimonas soli]
MSPSPDTLAPETFAQVRLDTPRLCVRTPDVEDLDDLLSIYAHPDIARYGTHAPWTDLDEARAWLERAESGHTSASALTLVLEDRATQHVIGTCVLFSLHAESRRAEIGYTLHREHWGRGLMHEALTAFIGHAFEAMKLRRIEADIDPANAASRRVLERQGFVHEGRLRERWCVGGQVTDTDLYGLLHHEWRRPDVDA